MNSVISLARIEVNVLYGSETDFEESILSLLRLKDDVGLKQIGFIAEDEVCSKWEDSKGKNISDVRDILAKHVQSPVDKLLMLCSLLIQYNNTAPLDTIISNLYGIYQMGGKRELGFDSEKEHLCSSVIWKEVIAGIYTLGALAVFFGRFEALPILVAKPWPKERLTEIQILRFWAIHAFTMLRREGRLKHPSLCLLAEEKVKQDKWLFKKFKNDQDLFLNSACQFDFLQCIYALFEGQTLVDVFPSFGIFYKGRTEPIVLDLILENKSRKPIIPNIADQELAQMIVSLDTFASREFSSYNGWSLNNWSNKIQEFLKKNLS